jgi:hypothetical protein
VLWGKKKKKFNKKKEKENKKKKRKCSVKGERGMCIGWHNGEEREG